MLSLTAIRLTLCALAVGAVDLRGESGNTEITESAGAWPEITRTTKPWTRWWWLGNVLDENALRVEMERYAAAGIGGLEITPIYGVRGQEDRFIEYLSPLFMERLAFVLREAERLDLGIDFATGNGWPFGGPWIERAHACKYLAHRTWTLPGGGRMKEKVELRQEPLVRVAGPRRVEIEELVTPVAANADLQDLALDQVRFPEMLPLVALVAHADDGRIQNLTTQVAKDGTLDWTAPAGGTWTLYGLFEGLHGKLVERAGPGGEGDVIDHFSEDAVGAHLAKFDEAFGASGVGFAGIRAFFNDSYEVDDAAGNADWTPRFLEEFQRRRGYDLLEQIPALFAEPATETTTRVWCDYRETISDLLLDEFTRPWRAWAAERGTSIRNQAHGSPANIIDLYAASDIPEQENSDLIGIKLASSAAHLTGTRLVSSEAATWIDEHFLGTLGSVKAATDLFFLAGVNHNCWHGTAYSPADEPWPGIHFYASIELNPSNPIWHDSPALNAYVARAQSLLQHGEPDEDVLLYYPIHDTWSERGSESLHHFIGRPRDGMWPWRRAAEALHTAGYGYDHVSDALLRECRWDATEIASAAGARYRTVVVPEVRTMPIETIEHLFSLAQRGATVVFHRALPGDVPGLHRSAQRLSRLQVFTEALQRSGTIADGVTTLEWGRGRVFAGEDVAAILGRAGLAREKLVDQGLRFVRRKDADGAFYFLHNSGATAVDGWVPLRDAEEAMVVLDAMTGRVERGLVRTGAGRAREIYLHLQPGASVFVRASPLVSVAAPTLPWRAVADGGVALASGWGITFVEGGPVLPEPIEVATAASWTDVGGAEAKRFGGTAVYRTTLVWNGRDTEGLRIDLGTVAESARVRLDGREVGTLFAAPYVCTIDATHLQRGREHVLEVEVTNLAANRIADLDRRGVNWKRFYNVNMPARLPENRGPDGLFTAAHWPVRPSGLVGPVTLSRVERFDPSAP
ncbi:glycosyl hydrolase [Opitutales bacterium ASA1]|uniref:glycosyl hydrolase n=1 Tax=Congregicoccus parvus TaxID=3081749 RepID=UPI002B2F8944|nr:glycosyl hydrolase [Opitutales bacterium ASA1]